MHPIFIQSGSLILDVSKVAHFKILKGNAAVNAYLINVTKLRIPRAEAEPLLDCFEGLAKKSLLTAIRMGCAPEVPPK